MRFNSSSARASGICGVTEARRPNSGVVEGPENGSELLDWAAAVIVGGLRILAFGFVGKDLRASIGKLLVARSTLPVK
jgi:predicted ABC-type sugar transport system permease subunit